MAPAPAAPSAPAPVSRAPGRSPWPLALLVIGAVGLLHLGLALVLTRGARAEVESIGAAWSLDELDGAESPGLQPETTGDAFAAWTRKRRLFEDAERWQASRRHVNTLSLALALSFFAQAGFVAFRAWRAQARA
jgi:hypothetical protein